MLNIMCKYNFIVIVVTLIFVHGLYSNAESNQFCSKDSKDSICKLKSHFSALKRYVLYDVNPPEGFNLRRDVYLRMAVFSTKLPKSEDWHLVLPPWPRLYHWRSTDVGKQSQLPWGLYFDIPSMQKFAPVVEMYDFLRDYGNLTIDQVYVLQHYKNTFEKGFKWEEKYDVEPCIEKNKYRVTDNNLIVGDFWGYTNLTARHMACLSFHGLASQLVSVVDNFTSVMFDHAEIALHDGFGDRDYWRARRSMRFSHQLRRIAEEYRRTRVNSTDEEDGTVRPEDWRQEKSHRSAVGGTFLCAHLRRRDFLWGRPKDVPSLTNAASQIRRQLDQLRLTTVFVSTDAPTDEVDELSELLSEYKVLVYEPDEETRQKYKDGGVAIIEQIICSHARHFIGTQESTFSFRIQEEREILGFPLETTFNSFCGDDNSTCKQPTQWRIVY